MRVKAIPAQKHSDHSTLVKYYTDTMANHQTVKSNEKLVTENDTKEQNGEAFGESKANAVNVDGISTLYAVSSNGTNEANN